MARGMATSSAALLALVLACSVAVCAARRSMQQPGTAAAGSQQQQVQRGGRQLLSKQSLLGLDKANKQLRVLAHGDSITEGWINTAWIKVPWTPKLQQQLQQRLGADWRVEVVNGGLGGAGVLDALNPLLQQQLADARGASRPYHFIIFEAGINDILMKNQKAPQIFERMKEMWAAANHDGATVLIVPTMPTNAQGEPEQQRRDLASKVREYVAAQHVAGNSGLQLIDLEEPFNYHSLPEAKRKELFDDGIHLTAAGYELMGDLIFAGMSRAMGL